MFEGGEDGELSMLQRERLGIVFDWDIANFRGRSSGSKEVGVVAVTLSPTTMLLDELLLEKIDMKGW